MRFCKTVVEREVLLLGDAALLSFTEVQRLDHWGGCFREGTTPASVSLIHKRHHKPDISCCETRLRKVQFRERGDCING